MINSFTLLSPVLPAFGFREEDVVVEPFGTGLINRTWKVSAAGENYILQKINQQVFTQPGNIAANFRLIADYLHTHHPQYVFAAPIPSINGEDLVVEGDGYYRLLPFISGSHAIDVVETPAEAYEAALQFGRFTRLLAGFDALQLKETIPSFHNLPLRYDQFLHAVGHGNKDRIANAKKEIREMLSHASIVEKFWKVKGNSMFKVRVTHHDTKISNVLFNAHNKGICVIDLDTVMPGYFFSDVGDMMRTYLSPVSEEECDFSKIVVREDFYAAIVQGYLSEMKDELTDVEKGQFFVSGQYLIYMQALRFLTDYFNDDIYYGESYEGHNLCRAQNQLVLLEQLTAKKDRLEKIA